MSLINKYMVDIPPDIQKSIRLASQITGAPEDYLRHVAALESSNDPNARNAKSSAKGLFQVLDETAKQVQKDHPDRDLRDRFNPNINAQIAGYLSESDRANLSRKYGSPVDDWMVYGAHRLGGGGFNTVQNNPNSIARDLLPEAAAANWSTFYDPQGTPRTGSQVSSLLKNKYNNADTRLFAKGPSIDTEQMFSPSFSIGRSSQPYNITFNDSNNYAPYNRRTEPVMIAESPTYSPRNDYSPGILSSESSFSPTRTTPSSSYGRGPTIGFSDSGNSGYTPSSSFAEKYWKGGTSFSDQ